MLYTYKYKEDLADAHRPNKMAPSTEQAALLQSFTENANFVFRYSPTANTIFRPILTSYVRNPLIMDDTELEIHLDSAEVSIAPLQCRKWSERL